MRFIVGEILINLHLTNNLLTCKFLNLLSCTQTRWKFPLFGNSAETLWWIVFWTNNCHDFLLLGWAVNSFYYSDEVINKTTNLKKKYWWKTIIHIFFFSRNFQRYVNTKCKGPGQDAVTLLFISNYLSLIFDSCYILQITQRRCVP